MTGFHRPYTCNQCEGYLEVKRELDNAQTLYSETIDILRKVQSGEINAEVLKEILSDLENENG